MSHSHKVQKRKEHRDKELAHNHNKRVIETDLCDIVGAAAKRREIKRLSRDGVRHRAVCAVWIGGRHCARRCRTPLKIVTGPIEEMSSQAKESLCHVSRARTHTHTQTHTHTFTHSLTCKYQTTRSKNKRRNQVRHGTHAQSFSTTKVGSPIPLSRSQKNVMYVDRVCRVSDVT